ncbi:MAG: hypothetical protein ACYC26_17445, partial [Phycisphaerales bacterium]
RRADQPTRTVPARRLVSFLPENLNPHRIMERLHLWNNFGQGSKPARWMTPALAGMLAGVVALGP